MLPCGGEPQIGGDRFELSQGEKGRKSDGRNGFKFKPGRINIMQVHKTVQRNLSETEEKTLKHFRYYFDNRKCFALIGDYVVAELSDENSGNPEKLVQEALDNISRLLKTPPDFTTYVMDDMFGLVAMNYGIYAVSPEKLTDEEIASDKVNIATALTVRSLCLEACEAGEIIAINDEEL